MAKNFNGTQINNSATIVEKAGAEIADCRNKIMKYDGNGNVVLATAGTDIPVGVALIEAGYNDISGAESGKVAIRGRCGHSGKGYRLCSCRRRNHKRTGDYGRGKWTCCGSD